MDIVGEWAKADCVISLPASSKQLHHCCQIERVPGRSGRSWKQDVSFSTRDAMEGQPISDPSVCDHHHTVLTASNTHQSHCQNSLVQSPVAELCPQPRRFQAWHSSGEGRMEKVGQISNPNAQRGEWTTAFSGQVTAVNSQPTADNQQRNPHPTTDTTRHDTPICGRIDGLVTAAVCL